MIPVVAQSTIVEEKLGIPGDYQYRALRSKNYLQASWHRNKLVALDRVVSFGNHDRVLDIGIGSGNFEFAFFNRVKTITGIDYHESAVNFARGKLKELRIKNVQLRVADATSISNLRAAQFERIVMVDVIEHISEENAKRVVAGIKKVLVPGGKAVIVTPNYGSVWAIVEKVMDMFKVVPTFSGEQHVCQYTDTKLVRVFEREGLKCTFMTSFNLFSHLVPNSAWSEIACGWEVDHVRTFGSLLMGVFEKRT